MAGKLPMGNKELIRGKLLEMVKARTLSLKEAALRMKVSYRQAKRIRVQYRLRGDAGLIHGNTGRPSNRRLDATVRERVLAEYRKKYDGCGPTFASEKLAEHEGIHIHRETLRRLLISEGLLKRQRRRNLYRSRRARRECFGEMVQFDGSHHDWFEGRRGGCCLMNMIDDATGRVWAFFCEEETTEAAMRLLWGWIERFGIPQAVYCDRKNAFVTYREPSVEEQLAGIEPETHFERACRLLGIEVIQAYSPQAKGRVERNHAVHQDRLVKELRLRGISTMEEANAFLVGTYLPAINAKFAKPAADPRDAHVPLTGKIDLRDIFCFEVKRVLSRDFIIQFEQTFYQVSAKNRKKPAPGNKVTVRKWLDGSLYFIWNNKKLLVEEFTKKSGKEVMAPLSA